MTDKPRYFQLPVTATPEWGVMVFDQWSCSRDLRLEDWESNANSITVTLDGIPVGFVYKLERYNAALANTPLVWARMLPSAKERLRNGEVFELYFVSTDFAVMEPLEGDDAD